MPTLSRAAKVGISAIHALLFVERTDALRALTATLPLQRMFIVRQRRFAAWLSLGVFLVVISAAHAQAGDRYTAHSDRATGVEARIPAQPTQALSLNDALQALPIVSHSRDAQRHQPPGFPCAGFYPAAPSYTITLPQDVTLRIGATAKNNVDMTLSVQLQDGTWICNDDAHENTRDPEVFEDFPQGTHTIYFGSYARFEPLHYQAHVVRDEKPDWTQCVEDDVIEHPNHTPTVRTDSVSQEVYRCRWMLGSTHCDWLLPSKANACVDVTVPTTLTVRTQNATFDTTLVLQKVKDSDDGPVADDLILRNDDIGPNDRHSRIEATLEAGRYLIFVGSYHRQNEGSFELHIGKDSTETP